VNVLDKAVIVNRDKEQWTGGAVLKGLEYLSRMAAIHESMARSAIASIPLG
jgi:hypothetical protein